MNETWEKEQAPHSHTRVHPKQQTPHLQSPLACLSSLKIWCMHNFNRHHMHKEPKVSTFIGICTWKLLVSNARRERERERERTEQGTVGMLIYKEIERERGETAVTNTHFVKAFEHGARSTAKEDASYMTTSISIHVHLCATSVCILVLDQTKTARNKQNRLYELNYAPIGVVLISTLQNCLYLKIIYSRC